MHACERIQRCLKSNCTSKLGGNQNNIIILAGSKMFGVCESTHLKDPTFRSELNMILGAALLMEKDGLISNETTPQEASTAPLCAASQIKSREGRCNKRCGKVLRAGTKDGIDKLHNHQINPLYGWKHYCSSICLGLHIKDLTKTGCYAALNKALPVITPIGEESDVEGIEDESNIV